MPQRTLTVVAFLLAIGLGGARPASAQIDLSGIWAPVMHEDAVERVAGPDIGDFLGLPINEAGRMRGETWDERDPSLNLPSATVLSSACNVIARPERRTARSTTCSATPVIRTWSCFSLM